MLIMNRNAKIDIAESADINLSNNKKKKKKKETFPSISLGVIEKYDKSAAIQISIVFRSMQHVGCRKVLWNGAF